MQCRDTDLGNDSILQQWSYIKSQMMDRCLFPGGYHLTISKMKGQLLDELKRNTWFLKRYTAIAESHNCVIIRSPRLFQERIFRNHFDKLRMQSAIFHEKHKHNYAWPRAIRNKTSLDGSTDERDTFLFVGKLWMGSPLSILFSWHSLGMRPQ